MPETHPKHPMAARFRGFLPVVIDTETAGFNPRTDALLEIAATLIKMDESGQLVRGKSVNAHVIPFPGANLERAALAFTGIDPYHPFRFAVPEREALESIFVPIYQAIHETGCSRAVLVGHNPAFDIGFLRAAVDRSDIKRNPFHAFTTFDTATLAGLAFGQTVLAKAVIAAGLPWSSDEAHCALYDAEKTADLFCAVVNRWDVRVAVASDR